jgi:aquaporin Z
MPFKRLSQIFIKYLHLLSLIKFSKINIYKMMNKYLVEFLGTLFLVFVIFATGNYLAIGAALAVAVLLGGAISGGAFNPAVAIALMYAGKIPRSDLIPYIVAQVAGGLAGFELFKMVVNRRA